MKKFAIISAFACLMAFFNQARAQYTITVGPKVGLGGTWFSGKNAPNNLGFKPAPVVGGFLTYSTENVLGFTIEASYTQKGYRTDYSTGATNFTQRLHYVEIPMLLRFFFGADGAQVRPNFFVGPSASFLVKGALIVDGNENTFTRTNTDSFKNFELGAHLGGGLNIRTADNQWLDVNLRLAQGLTNINDVTTAPYRDHRFYNSGLLFSVGYGFGI